MSFFDEVDEPPRAERRTTPRGTPRNRPRPRRPSGTGGGRRPPDQQSIQVRRAVALGAIVIVIVLIALGVHSCQVSANNSALQDYTNSASSLINQSNANGTALFGDLAHAPGASGALAVQTSVNQTLHSADSLLSQAKGQSVPDQLRTANRNLVMVLRMRADGIAKIANQIQPALGSPPSLAAVNAIASETARFYASDVLYKDYVIPEVYSAMSSAGVRFGGLPSGQFVHDLSWLLPRSVASNLNVTVPGLAPAKIAPGLHGHQLNSVEVAGTTLQTGSQNTVSSKSPTFTLRFANSGTNPETDVRCKVSINGTSPSISGTSTVPETLPGKDATCQVKLAHPAPAGTQTVDAQIEAVPGEKRLDNNSISYTVTFP